MKKEIGLMMVIAGLAGCGPRGNQPNVELIQDMMETPAIRAQEFDPWFKNNQSALVPPSNTQPVGLIPYRYDVNQAEKELKNPMAGNVSPEVLLVGQKYYSTNCLVCHGQGGHGDGPVSQKYPPGMVKSLVSDQARSFSDARLYHIITAGQGVMGPYGPMIPQEYRWQIVNYVRFLQSQDKR